MNESWEMVLVNDSNLDREGYIHQEWRKVFTYNIGDQVISHHNTLMKRKRKRFNNSKHQMVTCERLYTATDTGVKEDRT